MVSQNRVELPTFRFSVISSEVLLAALHFQLPVSKDVLDVKAQYQNDQTTG